MSTPLFSGTHAGERFFKNAPRDIDANSKLTIDLNRNFTDNIDAAIFRAFEVAWSQRDSMNFLYLPEWRPELFTEQRGGTAPFTFGFYRPNSSDLPLLYESTAPEQKAQILTTAGVKALLPLISPNPHFSDEVLENYTQKLKQRRV